MKKLLSLLFFYCMAAHAQKDTKAPVKMEGVYAMTKQVFNNSIKDSVLPTKQLKIFNGRYVMYAAPVSPSDSMASFGMGNYRVENGKVIEYFFYRASDGAQKDTTVLAIEKLPNGYKQVIVFPPYHDTVYTLIEEYDKIDRPTVSPIDGAWRLTKSYFVRTNGDTGFNKVTQYKMFYNGHFIWGAGFVDSASNKNKGVFGYGNFKMNGNKLTETNTNSSYVSQLINKPVDLDIKFVSKDEYIQTIIWPNNQKAVEFYSRMK
ncbi:MAG: hypothetical protein ABIN01_17565 [Ferruginibacter sp.]